VTYSEHTDAAFAMASGLALCQVSQGRSTPINFRKGAFSKQGRGRELNLAQLKQPLLATGAVLFCMLTSLTIQYSVYSKRIKDVDSQLERSVKSFFPGASSSAVRNYLSNLSSLRSAVTRDLAKQRDIAALHAPNPRSPLDFLKSLSAGVPKDIVVDLIQFQSGAAPAAGGLEPDPSTSLTFLVDNPQAAERLGNLISSKISGLQRSKLDEFTAPDGKKRFRITFTGKILESSYGK
jgi:hypothetical protein